MDRQIACARCGGRGWVAPKVCGVDWPGRCPCCKGSGSSSLRRLAAALKEEPHTLYDLRTMDRQIEKLFTCALVPGWAEGWHVIFSRRRIKDGEWQWCAMLDDQGKHASMHGAGATPSAALLALETVVEEEIRRRSREALSKSRTLVAEATAAGVPPGEE